MEDKMAEDLREVRNLLAREGCQSWTSEKYQNDVYSFVLENQEHGKGIVEIGCYKGGLSVFLAFVSQKLGWPFYTIDINQQFIGETKNLLGKLALDDHVTFFVGTLNQFVEQVKLADPALLVIVDGDHHYEGVLNDIKNIYRMNYQSYAAVFHDFSLRHEDLPDERVDKAIYDFWGDEVSLLRIGEQFDENTSYPLKNRPGPDGHYWELNGSEGVIVKLHSNSWVNQFKHRMIEWWKKTAW